MTESKPEKVGYEFTGWVCDVTGEGVIDSANLNTNIFEADVNFDYQFNCADYNGAVISFTALWKDVYQDVVKVIYCDNDGTIFMEDTITQELADNTYKTTFEIMILTEISQKDGYTFEGWTLAGFSTIYPPGSDTGWYDWESYGSGDYNNPTIVKFIAQWTITSTPDDTEEIVISESGTYAITGSLTYRLGEGTWTVDNGSDGYEYVGGNLFCVKESKEYIFTKK